jgi:hypothetical protein
MDDPVNDIERGRPDPERKEPAGATPGRKTSYAPPRIEKRRAVSRATLFTGSGPDSGGIAGT